VGDASDAGASEAWTADTLRAAALQALGAQADERAVDVLAHGEFVLLPAEVRWEASAGTVEAHRVTLGLDARRLGLLRAAPGVADAVCAAVAAAMAIRPGKSLLELSMRWSGGRAIQKGYRDAPAPPPSLRQALVEYLEAAGEALLARRVASAQVCADASGLVLLVDRATCRAWRDHPGALAALTRAARDLSGNEDARAHARPRG
jgi:hypothetical protein